MPQTLTKQVESEYDFIETVKEEKTKLVRRIMIFLLISFLGNALLFGIFYPVMKYTGDNDSFNWTPYRITTLIYFPHKLHI